MSSTPVIIVPPINKKTLFILWVLCFLGFLAVIPYQYTLAGKTLTTEDLLSIDMIKGTTLQPAGIWRVDLRRAVHRPPGWSGSTNTGWFDE